MDTSPRPLSSGNDHGTGAVNAGCTCIQCRLTSLFKKITALHVTSDDADELLDVMDGMFDIIRVTGMVYRVLPCPALKEVVKEIDEIAHELTGMYIGARLKTAVKRLQEISL